MVGTGSKRQVDGLDGEIIEVSWRWSIGEILSKYISGFTAVSNVPVFVDESVPVEGRRKGICL